MKKVVSTKTAILLDSELQVFLTERVSMSIKIKARRSFKSFKKQLESYYEERNNLVQELGEKTEKVDKAGNVVYNLNNENQDEFRKQNNEALEKEIEVEVELTLDDLEKVPEESKNFYGNLIDLFI